ncbi:MAG: tRNA-uridine aminocarboxypropyltransferase [Bdellovibrionota bacterium]
MLKTARASTPFTPRPRSLTAVSEARPTCYTCVRPLSHCVCGFIEPFTAHCNLLLLQHPHERRKYCSTTKLVMNAIRNARMLRGVEFDENEIRSAIADSSRTYLLYPSSNARPCETAHLDSDCTVIVIDGTWDEAQKIVYRNGFAHRFECLSFQQSFRSTYRIRKQPKDYCLSTLESIAYLLKLNAEANGLYAQSKIYDRLFDGFDRMVAQQLEHQPLTRRLPEA